MNIYIHDLRDATSVGGQTGFHVKVKTKHDVMETFEYLRFSFITDLHFWLDTRNEILVQFIKQAIEVKKENEVYEKISH